MIPEIKETSKGNFRVEYLPTAVGKLVKVGHFAIKSAYTYLFVVSGRRNFSTHFVNGYDKVRLIRYLLGCL